MTTEFDRWISKEDIAEWSTEHLLYVWDLVRVRPVNQSHNPIMFGIYKLHLKNEIKKRKSQSFRKSEVDHEKRLLVRNIAKRR